MQILANPPLLVLANFHDLVFEPLRMLEQRDSAVSLQSTLADGVAGNCDQDKKSGADTYFPGGHGKTGIGVAARRIHGPPRQCRDSRHGEGEPAIAPPDS